MSLSKKNINGFCILNIEGRIDTTNYISFEKDIREVINSGEDNIIFNCSGLDYISSSGLRVFLIALKMLMGSNGKLHLCEMQPAIKVIFDISNFSSIFKIFESEEEALQA